jgi:hypothetical protein
MREALTQAGIIGELSDDVVNVAIEIAENLRHAPTEYYEAKPARPVKFNEFTGAIVPSTASPKLREMLTRHGIEIREYPAGDMEARQQIADTFTTERALKFQREPASVGGAPAPVEGGAPKYATAPAEPPKPPAEEEVQTKVTGQTMAEAGVEAPRVETKVEKLKKVAPEAELSREDARTWKSLDPAIQDRFREVVSDPNEQSRLLRRAAEGKIDDVDVQVMDALVNSRQKGYEAGLEKLMRAQEEGTATGPESVEYLRASLDQLAAHYVKTARSDIEAGTKLARALAARARVMEADISATNPDAFIKQLFKQIPDLSDKDATALLRIFKERPQDLAGALHSHMERRWPDKLLEAWKAGLVSSPGTQVANLLGNAGEQIMRVGETATSALLDSLIGGRRTRLSGEARAELSGAMKGAGKSIGQLGQDLWAILRAAPEEINIKEAFEHQVGAISGKKGRIIRTPFRFLAAADRFFRGLGHEAELHKLAYRAAEGDKAKMAAILADPPKEMLEAATKSATERVFQDPNAAARAVLNLRSKYKFLQVLAPFVQTPTAIAIKTLQRSPAGFVEGFRALSKYREALKSGADDATVDKLRGEALDKMARPLLGTALIGTFVAVAKSGGMTGSGPVDDKERNLLKDAGWQPYSFVIPHPEDPEKKLYIPFNRFEPVSSLLGFAADIAEAPDARTGNDLLSKGVGSAVENLFSKTYLQGIAEAAEVINDPMRFGSAYISNLAGSAVPNIVAKGAQAIDPTLRDVRGAQGGLAGIPERITRTIQSRIPGLSQALPERRSGTGEVVERRGSALSRFLSPVQPSLEEEDLPFARLLVDLEAVPAPPRKDIKVRGKDVRLTDEEFAAVQAADQKTTKALHRLTLSPGFRRLDEESKRQIIRNNYERGRAAVRNQVLRTTAFRRRAQEVVRGARA